MTEAAVATKAPDSDVTEVVTPAAPAASSSGPGMSEHCTTDRPTPAGQASTGEMTKLKDVDVYVSKPADYPHAPARLLLLLTGGTGLGSTNNQIQADRFASDGGFLVVMPDLFRGDAAPNSRATAAAAATASTDGAGGGGASSLTQDGQPEQDGAPVDDGGFLGAIKLKAAEAAKSFLIDMWLARHTEERVMPILHAVLEGCRETYADAVAFGGGVYAVGYCFGARYILLLAADQAKKEPPAAAAAGAGNSATSPLAAAGGWAASAVSSVQNTFFPSKAPGAAPVATEVPEGEDDGEDEGAAGAGEATTAPTPAAPITGGTALIKAGALAHATLVSPHDFEGLVAPLSLCCVEEDPLFPDEVRAAGEEALERQGVEHEVKVYPGVPHGFAIVGEYDDANIKAAQATAYDQMLKWLKEH